MAIDVACSTAKDDLLLGGHDLLLGSHARAAHKTIQIISDSRAGPNVMGARCLPRERVPCGEEMGP